MLISLVDFFCSLLLLESLWKFLLYCFFLVEAVEIEGFTLLLFLVEAVEGVTWVLFLDLDGGTFVLFLEDDYA